MEQPKTPLQEFNDNLAACARDSLCAQDVLNITTIGDNTFIGIKIGLAKRIEKNDKVVDNIVAGWHLNQGLLDVETRTNAIQKMVTIATYNPYGHYKIMPILTALAENGTDITPEQLQNVEMTYETNNKKRNEKIILLNVPSD